MTTICSTRGDNWNAIEKKVSIIKAYHNKTFYKIVINSNLKWKTNELILELQHYCLIRIIVKKNSY